MEAVGADRNERQQPSEKALPLSEVSSRRPEREQQAVRVDFTVVDTATAEIRAAFENDPQAVSGALINVLDAAVQQQTIQLYASEVASTDAARKVVRLSRLVENLRELQLEQSECEEAAKQGDEAEQQRIADYIPCLCVKIKKDFAALDTRDADGHYSRDFDELYEDEWDARDNLQQLAADWRRRHTAFEARNHNRHIRSVLSRVSNWREPVDVSNDAPERAGQIDYLNSYVVAQAVCRLKEKEAEGPLSPQEEVSLEQLNTFYVQLRLIRAYYAELCNENEAVIAQIQTTEDQAQVKRLISDHVDFGEQVNRRIAHFQARLKIGLNTFQNYTED